LEQQNNDAAGKFDNERRNIPDHGDPEPEAMMQETARLID
jgi:hypothetical protein